MSDTSPERLERIKTLFADALSAGPAARAAVLDEACAGDLDLRTAVDDLLANYEAGKQFFARFPVDFARDALGVAEPPRTFAVGDLVGGRFQIASFLGAGGMGEVYEAEDLLLGRERVALKTLHPDFAGDARAVARLTRELALARQVTDVNVCRVFDVDQHVSPSGAAVAFFTMELLKGETLAERLARVGPLSSTAAYPLIQQMVAALEAAHAAGIVHGDFKPGNIVLVPLTEGGERLVVTDFGLARRATTDAAARAANTSGPAWGTPLYMAPEQLAGRATTRVTDVYALAAVVFEMVTGEQACEAELPASGALDDRWRSAILRCLDRNPAVRFQTAAGLLAALRTGAPRAPVRWRRVAGSVVLGLAALLLIPSVRGKLGATIEGGAAAPVDAQNVVVLAAAAPDRTPDAAAFSRGLAAVITDQLGAPATDTPRFRFLPAAGMIGADTNSPVRAHRALGADLLLTITIAQLSAQRRVTLDLDDASAQQPRRILSRALAIDDGDPVVPQVRREVARMLASRLPQAAATTLDPHGPSPALAEVSYLRGRGFLEQARAPALDVARLDLAIAAFRQALALDKEYAAAHADLGETLVLKYAATKDTHKDTQLLALAEQSADEACRLQPAVAHFHVVRALTYLATGQHKQAIPALEQALSLDPDAGGASETLARSYAATGQLPQAERTLQEAVARRPRDWSAHGNLGTFRVNQGRYREAEVEFLAGREHAPDNPRVISNLAGLYTMTELFDAAEQELTRGVALAPDPILLNNLGWVYFYQENFPKGVESMKAAALLAPTDSVILAGLARGYRWMGRSEDAHAASLAAIAAARRQISANPRNAVVRANLAYLYAETSDRGEASSQIAQALDDAPDNVRVRFTSALVFELMGQRPRALEALKSAIGGGLPKYQLAHHPDLRTLRADSRYVETVGAPPGNAGVERAAAAAGAAK